MKIIGFAAIGGFSLGAVPGVAIFLAGWRHWGMGFSLILGVATAGLCLASVLFKTSGSQALNRSVIGALGILLRYNLPGIETLAPAKLDSGRLRKSFRRADESRLFRHMKAGAILGPLAAGYPSYWILLQLDEGNEPFVVQVVLYVGLWLVLTFFFGALLGAAISTWTVRGIEGVITFLGALGGALIGVGVGMCCTPDHVALQWYSLLGFAVVVGAIGLGGAFLSLFYLE